VTSCQYFFIAFSCAASTSAWGNFTPLRCTDSDIISGSGYLDVTYAILLLGRSALVFLIAESLFFGAIIFVQQADAMVAVLSIDARKSGTTDRSLSHRFTDSR
jgi:hypothetical protein